MRARESSIVARSIPHRRHHELIRTVPQVAWYVGLTFTLIRIELGWRRRKRRKRRRRNHYTNIFFIGKKPKGIKNPNLLTL